MKSMALCVLLGLSFSLCAQINDPEYPKGFIMHARLHNGMLTKFGGMPDAYLGGLQLVPQVTLVPHKLRAGIVAGAFYTQQKLQALAGPAISWKVKTLYASFFGSAGNINLSADHWWGTGGQHLAGGGINLDIGNLLLIGLGAHRDYRLNNWWIQQSLGLRLSKKKKIVEPYNQ